MAKMVWKTEDDLLEDIRQAKKSELSASCQEDILSGYEIMVDGDRYTASYDREAQVNLQERFALFENNLVESVIMTLHKGEEDVRLEINKEEFMSIYLSSVVAKEDKISRLRDILFPRVAEASSKEELEAITWGESEDDIEEPSIIFDDGNTLEKQITETKVQTDRIQQSLSMTNSGLLELTLLTMMSGGN